MDVYNELGPGFLEPVYQEAMKIELTARDIPFESQPELHIFYKGGRLNKHYIADFSMYGKIIAEIKAIKNLSSIENAQLLNEIKSSKFKLGLLSNFGNHKKLEWKRMINTR
jgi:GxxExxY protein